MLAIDAAAACRPTAAEVSRPGGLLGLARAKRARELQRWLDGDELFREQVGLEPKSIARVLRLERSLALLERLTTRWPRWPWQPASTIRHI